MKPADLDVALLAARVAILTAADPDAALARLHRHARREMAFNASPAALTRDELAAAASAGVSPQVFAGSRRRLYVHDFVHR
jgi:hypothetical protein